LCPVYNSYERVLSKTLAADQQPSTSAPAAAAASARSEPAGSSSSSSSARRHYVPQAERAFLDLSFEELHAALMERSKRPQGVLLGFVRGGAECAVDASRRILLGARNRRRAPFDTPPSTNDT
jgi:hypothetical protein